jgi:hypothetical protein
LLTDHPPWPPLHKGGKVRAALDELAQRKREERSCTARPSFQQQYCETRFKFSIAEGRRPKIVQGHLEARFYGQAQESRSLGAHLGDIYDADIDGPEDLPLKKAPTTRAPWLLVGIALISLVWAATSIFLFIRAEQVRRPTAHLPSTPDVSAHPVRPSAVRPLFADIPARVRRKGLPGSEVSLAADVRATEERGGDTLWTSHEALGVRPTTSQTSVSDGLKRHVSPGRAIDGWLMKVNWSILRGAGSSKYNYTRFPPVYELNLRFPEDLAGYEVWLRGLRVIRIIDAHSIEIIDGMPSFDWLSKYRWRRLLSATPRGQKVQHALLEAAPFPTALTTLPLLRPEYLSSYWAWRSGPPHGGKRGRCHGSHHCHRSQRSSANC